MFYYIIFLLSAPFLFFLNFFRKTSKKNLIIQTAKIGDYVNTSIMFDVLKNTDLVIDKINIPFASNDTRIINFYTINYYKKNLLKKLKLAFIIFFNNYDNVYIVLPNSYNIFLGHFSFSKNKVTISSYADKKYNIFTTFKIKKIKHSVNNLTLDTYIKLINKNLDYKNFTKKIQMPLKTINSNLINKKTFNIGISLTAANKLKTIDINTWKEIFSILDKFNCNIYIFGLKNEEFLLVNLKKHINLKKANLFSLLNKIDLKYLPYEISKLNLYISSDTGNSYIADSVNVPTINFAGPCFWTEQRPVLKNKSLIIKSNATCTPYSSVFRTVQEKRCKNIFSINKKQKEKILNFINYLFNNNK